MYFSDGTLDDLLRRVLQKLLQNRNRIKTTRGYTSEISGVLLRLKKPRARLSRTERKGKVFSGLGELLWYLSGSDKLDFIAYYLSKYEEDSEDGKTLGGAYGPRIFDMRGQDQLSNVVQLLSTTPNSRRAVIQLFNAEDISQTAERKLEIPCTCTLQFLVRRNRLNLYTSMRSNDAFVGLPHDVFAFTMIQEIVARHLGRKLGEYRHFVGSLHLYSTQTQAAKQYVNEGWQPTADVRMPRMPDGDPWPSIKKVLKAEDALRKGRDVVTKNLALDVYWQDLIRLLQIYALGKRKLGRKIGGLKKQMSCQLYDTYISRREVEQPAEFAPLQKTLPFK